MIRFNRKTPRVHVNHAVPKSLYTAAKKVALDRGVYEWEIWAVAVDQFLRKRKNRRRS